jgi:hypothetical protein
MTGPEHYRAAEELLESARRWEREIVDETDSYASIDSARAAAQVHATLALAAAQIEQVSARGPGDVDQTWIDAMWRGGVA